MTLAFSHLSSLSVSNFLPFHRPWSFQCSWGYRTPKHASGLSQKIFLHFAVTYHIIISHQLSTAAWFMQIFSEWETTVEKSRELELCRVLAGAEFEKALKAKLFLFCFSSSFGMRKLDCEEEWMGLAGASWGMNCWMYCGSVPLKQLYADDCTL